MSTQRGCTAGEKTVVVIPARGGSKGILRKNLALVAGQPLVVWAIQAALRARTIDAVYVSTDDPDIERVSRVAGASVIRRPPELASDTASSESALLHALDVLARRGIRPGTLVFLQCTAPLMTSTDIDGTVRTLRTQRADSAFAAIPFHHFLWRQDPSGKAVAINHDACVRLRRQDAEPQYLEAGSVYAMNVDGFRKARHRFFGKVVLHPTQHETWLEVDTPAQLALVDTILRARLRAMHASLLPQRIDAVAFDFDGVFTDNTVRTDSNGRESVVCNRSDGLALSQLRAAGVRTVVISSETNPAVAARCNKLGVECLQVPGSKLNALRVWASANKVRLNRTVFVGNDVNDVECLQACGCGVAVADAWPEARNAARFILTTAGGHGAVREICRLVLQHMGRQ